MSKFNREFREAHNVDKCPQCGKFVNPDGDVYFHCAERVPADEWDMHPVAAFCTEKCANRFHRTADRELASSGTGSKK
jgi:YHS domain-containing protein